MRVELAGHWPVIEVPMARLPLMIYCKTTPGSRSPRSSISRRLSRHITPPRLRTSSGTVATLKDTNSFMHFAPSETSPGGCRHDHRHCPRHGGLRRAVDLARDNQTRIATVSLFVVLTETEMLQGGPWSVKAPEVSRRNLLYESGRHLIKCRQRRR